MMKKIAKAQVLTLKEQVSYQEGQVVSKTLAQNSALSVTLFSFDKGEEISAPKIRRRACGLSGRRRQSDHRRQTV